MMKKKKRVATNEKKKKEKKKGECKRKKIDEGKQGKKNTKC